MLAGQDDDLANRVRAVLRMPQVLRPRAGTAPQSIDAKIMAERSIKAGYMKDALKYLEVAHESDPGDFDVMRKLGWTNNILHRDAMAWRWFDLARRSPDPTIAADADRGFRNLHAAAQRVSHHCLALSPVFHPLARSVRLRPGQDRNQPRDFRCTPTSACASSAIRAAPSAPAVPQYLSESSFILAVGAATRPWHGITAWGEAGTAISYLKGHMLPDYRGGVSVARGLASRGKRLVRRRHAGCALRQPLR